MNAEIKAPQTRWREIIEGNRFAGFPEFLKDECFSRDLDLAVLQVDNGWIRQTVRFEVRGDEDKIAALKRSVYAAIKAYNAQ